MQTLEMPLPGFTLRESEKLLGCSEKYMYKLVHDGKIGSYKDVTGQLRIPYAELYAFIRAGGIKQYHTRKNSSL